MAQAVGLAAAVHARVASTVSTACPFPRRRTSLPDEGRDGRLSRGVRGALRAARAHGRARRPRCGRSGGRYMVVGGRAALRGRARRRRDGELSGAEDPRRSRPSCRPTSCSCTRARTRTSASCGPAACCWWVPATRARRSPSSVRARAAPSWLAGRDVGHVPFRIDGCWRASSRRSVPTGVPPRAHGRHADGSARRAPASSPRAGRSSGSSPKDLRRAGVERVAARERGARRQAAARGRPRASTWRT